MKKILLTILIATTVSCSSIGRGKLDDNGDGTNIRTYGSKSAEIADVMSQDTVACYGAVKAEALARLKEAEGGGRSAPKGIPFSTQGASENMALLAWAMNEAGKRANEVTMALIEKERQLALAELDKPYEMQTDSCAGLSYSSYKIKIKRENTGRMLAFLDFGKRLIPFAALIGGVWVALHEAGIHAQGTGSTILQRN